MKIETFLDTVGCHAGSCPTIYKSDRDTFIVQGNLVDPGEISQLKVPSHEGVVEIPGSLVRALACKIASER